MKHEDDPLDGDSLTERQELILQQVLQEQHQIEGLTPHFTFVFDQLQTAIREDVSEDFELGLATRKEYFAFMAGMLVGTQYMDALLQNDAISSSIASQAIRLAVAKLAPESE